MRIGCFNKIEGRVDYIYVSDRVKSLPHPYGKEPYVQFIIDESKDILSYEWNGTEVVSNPNYVSPTPDYTAIAKEKIKDSIEFAADLMLDFSSENVVLGITQNGKTKDVSDYLADMTRYLQTGSLYEVINEIDYLVAQGIPSDLSPYVTDERMGEFKQRILDYLS